MSTLSYLIDIFRVKAYESGYVTGNQSTRKNKHESFLCDLIPIRIRLCEIGTGLFGAVSALWRSIRTIVKAGYFASNERNRIVNALIPSQITLVRQL